MPEITFPELPHWLGTDEKDEPPSARTLDDAAAYFRQSIDRTRETWIEAAGALTLTPAHLNRRLLYLNAANSTWTLPAGLNAPLPLGIDGNGDPITLEAAAMLEIWQLGNGQVTLTIGSGLTVYKESGLTAIRTNGVATLLTVIYFANARNAVLLKAG